MDSKSLRNLKTTHLSDVFGTTHPNSSLKNKSKKLLVDTPNYLGNIKGTICCATSNGSVGVPADALPNAIPIIAISSIANISTITIDAIPLLLDQPAKKPLLTESLCSLKSRRFNGVLQVGQCTSLFTMCFFTSLGVLNEVHVVSSRETWTDFLSYHRTSVEADDFINCNGGLNS